MVLIVPGSQEKVSYCTLMQIYIKGKLSQLLSKECTLNTSNLP